MKILLRQLQSPERHLLVRSSSVGRVLSQNGEGYFHCQKATLKIDKRDKRGYRNFGGCSFNLLIWCHLGSSESVAGLVRGPSISGILLLLFIFFFSFHLRYQLTAISPGQ